MKQCFLLLIGFSLGASYAFSQAKPKQVAKSQPRTEMAQPVTPAPEPPQAASAPSDPSKPVVAIYYFTTTRNYSYDYAIGVGNAVEAGFVRSTRFTIVERNRFGMLKDEERFKEANTSDLIGKASKLGAKTIVTGHLVGVSTGNILSVLDKQPTGRQYTEISLSFKVIDVASGEIKISEIINGRGEGTTSTETLQNAYVAIDKIIRAYIGNYLPQRFKFANVVATNTRKKVEYLESFKIWGGSDNGLKVGDAVEIYILSYLINPETGKQVEERKLIAHATISEINSGSTATCIILDTRDASKYNPAILNTVTTQQGKITIEYKGNWYEKPKSFWDKI
ncbi:MAG: hypothetical protein INR73_06230 [Williamsia sp.]|nr:hypothetical protein [Williamsia sp.]